MLDEGSEAARKGEATNIGLGLVAGEEPVPPSWGFWSVLKQQETSPLGLPHPSLAWAQMGEAGEAGGSIGSTEPLPHPWLGQAQSLTTTGHPLALRLQRAVPMVQRNLSAVQGRVNEVVLPRVAL